MELRVNPEEKYTYEDYLTWDDDIRYELIDGVPFMMSTPNTAHQRVSINLVGTLGTYLKGKKYKAFAAPFDIRFNWDSKNNTVVQPDVVVYCDVNKLDEQGGKGAPDLVIEILSPSTFKRDKGIKRALYENFKVKEYWIVDPGNCVIEAFTLKNDLYHVEIYDQKDTIPVGIFEDFSIDLSEIFEE